ncbi:pirin family protein [Providencia stuartii]|uniref:pirin family protein n=1 Tax=Providencia TaxID=586 RepID=UPI0027F5576B|nr:pirin family protein [Providencia sp. 2023EL-00965]ELR5302043.1 pirin family protein [Providencia stuartii]MDW7590533.1 pirin family protein [Providencia sp. 2023EL-00965]
MSIPTNQGELNFQQISARIKDVGGLPVSRVLPTKERRLIGAWCFLDHAGPTVFKGDSEGMRVAPHPHTGLQTFTWMIEGEVLHRDSLGCEQVIRPGQVNLMTAGKGISHSEDTYGESHKLHAVQLWIALPEAVKDIPPRFDHYPTLPEWSVGSAKFHLLVGEYETYKAPTLSFSSLIGLDITTRSDEEIVLFLRPEFEYGIFVIEGNAVIEAQHCQTNQLIYLGQNLSKITINLSSGSHLLLLGGEPLHESILMWWNFIGRTKIEIATAIKEWNQGSTRFGKVINDDRIPTPSPLMP